MTLTRTSVLHYWSSRYGALPVIGGKPTFSRNSAGSVADVRGELYDAIINTPRFARDVDQSTTAAELRAALLLERGGTNLVASGDDFSHASWSRTNVALAGGYPDAAGGATASQVTATGAGSSCYCGVAFSGGTVTRPLGIEVKQGSAAAAAIGLFNATSGSFAARLVITFNTSGQPTVAFDLGAGTVRAIETLVGGWFRIWFTCAVTSSNTNQVYFYPTNGASSGTVYARGVQSEDSPALTSRIRTTGSTASRGAEEATWTYAALPQALAFYARFVDRGTALTPTTGLWCIGDTAGNAPKLMLYCVSAGAYRLHYQATSGGTAYVFDFGGTAVGATIEFVGILTAAGSIRGIQSVNGAAVTDSGAVAGAALPAAWSAPVLQLGQFQTSAPGVAAFLDARIVRQGDLAASTGQAIMDELRAFELGPNGEVL